ncbi:hypothetical protein T02_14628 [Trichinella nativa]|uniref:Uncharacterized protein n=1 Tax=Trichinella nativa TaxID=6335 RepID=A0A0V1LAF4_9BILA|nr:hypothetical protein T02_14628 [Trichinella nativa]
MYCLAEVEVAALYPRIQEVALNCGYQGCFKITNYCLWIEIDNEDCRFVANLVYNSDRREPKETPSKNWKILCLPITFGVSEKRLREQIFDEMRSDTTTLV